MATQIVKDLNFAIRERTDKRERLEKMKILVTGGAGFIGSHITDTLMERGHSVRVYDRRRKSTHSGRRQNILNRKQNS